MSSVARKIGFIPIVAQMDVARAGASQNEGYLYLPQRRSNC
jgi:hypothetical protein